MEGFAGDSKVAVQEEGKLPGTVCRLDRITGSTSIETVHWKAEDAERGRRGIAPWSGPEVWAIGGMASEGKLGAEEGL
jgi:hypothetical protein